MTIKDNNHHSYKGENAKYSAMHMWIKRYSKKGMCTLCNKKHHRTEWAFIHNRKSMRDIKNFIELCPSCHRRYDFTEEIRENMSRSKIGIITYWRHKPVIATKENIKYNFVSITEATKKLDILHTSIANCLSRRSKTAGGFQWNYNNR